MQRHGVLRQISFIFFFSAFFGDIRVKRLRFVKKQSIIDLGFVKNDNTFFTAYRRFYDRRVADCLVRLSTDKKENK